MHETEASQRTNPASVDKSIRQLVGSGMSFSSRFRGVTEGKQLIIEYFSNNKFYKFYSSFFVIISALDLSWYDEFENIF